MIYITLGVISPKEFEAPFYIWLFLISFLYTFFLCLLILEPPCLIVTVQTCMGSIAIKKNLVVFYELFVSFDHNYDCLCDWPFVWAPFHCQYYDFIHESFWLYIPNAFILSITWRGWTKLFLLYFYECLSLLLLKTCFLSCLCRTNQRDLIKNMVKMMCNSHFAKSTSNFYSLFKKKWFAFTLRQWQTHI